VNAVTVNKVCGSGLEAVMQAANMIRLGDAQCVVAGGMENMDLAPHLAQVRGGIKYGEGKLIDHMQFDGLTCAFENWPMGNAAEHTASTCGVTRAEQDAFSVESHRRAAEATKNGWFKAEMIALTPEQCMAKTGLDVDEGFRADSSMDGLAKLRPAFTKDGSVTAGNASQISDGAAAVLVMSEAKAKELGLKVLAKIVGYGTAGVAPKDLFIAPKVGIEQLLAKTSKKVSDIDLFEVNEAFAAQVLAAYGVGLIAAVSIRSIVASFHARGDTKTPMIVSLVAVTLNVGLKLVLVDGFGVMGLALATALGATLNLAALVWIADNRGWIEPDGAFGRAAACAGAAAAALAGTLLLTYPLIEGWLGAWRFGKELRLIAHGLTGGIVYGVVALAIMRITGLSLRRAGHQQGNPP
jgi:acetyl-CoA C-acetyltransferase